MRASTRFSLCILALLLLATLQCSKSKSVDDDEQDGRPPELIADLHVITITSTSLTLQWTAPADFRDDNSAGFIQEYDLRVSYDSITSSNFAAAYRIDSIPPWAPAGAIQQTDVDLLEPDSTYYFAMRSRDDKGNWSGISNCCMGHCPPIEVVTFADAALEGWVRGHVGKPTGDILSTDVDTILYLELPQAGLVSLSGAEHFTSLVGANLWDNQIVDLSPLADLTHIAGLSLGYNLITDLTPLTGMQELRQLHIFANPLTNIGPLASVPSLQQLFLWGCPVTDFSPLYGLEILRDVHFATMNLTDISFMSHLTHLRICKLNSNNITSIAPLAGLVEMEGLDLMMNQISDVGPLSTLVNLSSLNLTYNSISDIQGLVDNTGLGTGDVVYLGENPLSTTALTVQIPALEARGVTVTH